ncbi:MAG TPA: hypothetical protein VGG10_07745 [Rhizomicrobium sp.]|jgi:uncharacterized membrane protein YphA (DoxX/SURF4 family)
MKTDLFAGRYVYGLGVIALALVCFAWGGFDPGQPVPKTFPYRDALAAVAATFMLVTGAAVLWQRTTAWAAAALVLYYTFVVVILLNGRLAVLHYKDFVSYSGTAEQLAIAAGGLILYAAYSGIDAIRAAQFTRAAQIVFGICAVLFGIAHFVYMNFTAPLVPKWLPPSQMFWGYATGVAQIAAGIAILTGVQARLAAILLTAMYASFVFLVHAPAIWASPHDHGAWAEAAETIALVGVAWLVADSFARGWRMQKTI